MNPHPLILLGIAMMIAGCSEGEDRYQVAETAAAQETLKYLKEITLPAIEFSDTPVRDAVDFLQQRSVEVGAPAPSHRISMSVDLPPSPDESTLFSTKTEQPGGFQPPGPAPEDTSLRITFAARDASFWDALIRVSEQANLSVKIDKLGQVHVSKVSANNAAQTTASPSSGL